MGKLEAQDDQSSDDAVGEHQLVTGSCSSRTHPVVAPAIVQSPLFRYRSRVGQLADQRTKSTAMETSEDTMGQGRAGQVVRHNNTNSRGLLHIPDRWNRHCRCSSALPSTLPQNTNGAAKGHKQRATHYPRQVRGDGCRGVLLEDHPRHCFPEQPAGQRGPPQHQKDRPTVPGTHPVIHVVIMRSASHRSQAGPLKGNDHQHQDHDAPPTIEHNLVRSHLNWRSSRP
ncbi:hypothetical protein AB0L71_31990 [Streptomyces sp. NPDC052052]|uniref:hypothetical protein n=1 Tax=Streptomyces sp. NPDC052052 TaxID=3154756 RepID=UPI0034331D0D